MLIIRDTTGVTIKRSIQTADHVRIGVLEITLWRGGVARGVRSVGRPHGEFDLNDCEDLLAELENLPGG
jgi:hypothetical protein